MSTPEAEVADWPELDDDAKARLRELMRPSGRGLARIDEQDVAEVLDGLRDVQEAAHG